jgi:hypothetical protein
VRGIKRRLLGLCIAPALLCALDTTLTLCGQLPQYWAGNHAAVMEGSPTFNQLLQVHPAAFLLGGAVWLLIFVAGILLLPDALALILSIAVTLGHAAGASSWLYGRFPYSYQLCNGLYLLTAILIGVSIRWGWRAVPEESYQFRRLPSFLRWGLVLALVAVGAYTYLWPRSVVSQHVADSRSPDVITEATATTDRDLERLSDQRQLTRLHLAGTEITADGLARFKELGQLTRLSLYDVRLTAAGLEHLARLRQLRSLRLSAVSIADSDRDQLATLTQLEDITLSGPTVSDAWLQPLGSLPRLQRLCLICTKVTDDGLKHLAGLTQLRTLYLMGGEVTDNGPKHLQALPELRSLYLGEMKITDAGLEHLKGLPQLKSLCLDCTNCTPQGKQKLRQSLPKCRID